MNSRIAQVLVLAFVSLMSVAFTSDVLAQASIEYPSTVKARSEALVTEYRGDLYVFNGFGPNIKIENTIEKFDVATRTWSVVGQTSVLAGTAVTHNGIVRLGQDVWIIGGRIGTHPGKMTNKVWIYNLQSGQWRTGPALPYPVASGGAALVNNRIHWFGGLDPNAACDVDRHFVYDLDLPSAGWQNITDTAAMPLPRNHFATAVADGRIYAIGGQHGHDSCRHQGLGDLSYVHAFDPETNVWERVADLPFPQSHAEPSTFEYQGYIYSVGGKSGINKVYRYNPQSDQWATVMSLPQPLLAPVSRIVDGRLMIAAGGPDTTRPVRQVHSYLIDTPTLVTNNDGMPDTDTEVVGNDSTSGESGNSEFSVLSIEAEFHDGIESTSTHQWVHKSLSGASNQDAMVTTPDYGALQQGSEGTPMLSYLVYFDKPGLYYLWVRGWGDTNSAGEGSSDSLHAGLNGSIQPSADKIDQFPQGWHWSRHTRDAELATINVSSAGINAVNLWMREDGLAIDKFVLTTDPDFIPEGLGPDYNDGTDDSQTIAPDDETGTATATDTDTDTDTDVVPPASDTGDEEGDSTSGQHDTDPVDNAGTGGEVVVEGESSETNSSDNDTTDGNQESSGLVYLSLESEDFDVNRGAGQHEWVASNIAGASGSGALAALPNVGLLSADNANSPQLSYSLNFTLPGTYYVWVRAWGDTNSGEGKNDSVHVGLNGQLDTAKAIQNFPANWSWSNQRRHAGRATLVVSHSGDQSVDVWMREDGLILDQLILTTDATFDPNTADYVSGQSGDTSGGSDTSGDTAGQGQSGSGSGSDSVISGNESSDDDVDTDESHDQSIGGVNVIVIEAESTAVRTAAGDHQWINGNKPNPQGTGSIVSNIDNGTLRPDQAQSPRLSYRVEFAEAGVYYVWVRGWGDTKDNEGKSDSIHVGLDGKLDTAKAIQNFPAEWTWSDQTRNHGKAKIEVPSSGMHTLDVWMREDGLNVDAFLLTRDASFNPNQNRSTGDVSSSVDESTGNTNTDSSNGDLQSDPLVRVDSGTTWRIQHSVDGSAVHARHEAGGVVVDGQIYVLGGRGNRSVDVYDPGSRKWTHKSTSPIELHHFQPVYYSDRIWIVGAFTGGYPDEHSVSHVYSYAPATDQWTQESIIPASRRRGGAGAVLHNGRILVVGGNTHGHRDGAKPWVDSYDPLSGEWQVMVDAPTARDHTTIAVVNDRLVVAGGRTSRYPNVFANTVGRTDVLDLTTGTWSVGATLPTQRAGTMTVAVGNEVIIMGGESEFRGAAHADVEAYNPATNQWRTLKSLNTGRHSGAAVVLDRDIHVISGSERQGGAPESTVHEILPF